MFWSRNLFQTAFSHQIVPGFSGAIAASGSSPYYSGRVTHLPVFIGMMGEIPINTGNKILLLLLYKIVTNYDIVKQNKSFIIINYLYIYMSDIFVIKSYKPLMIGNSFLRSFKGLLTKTFTSFGSPSASCKFSILSGGYRILIPPR